MTTFTDLGVPASLVRTLADQGIEAPFPIQTATLPDSLGGTRRARPRPHRLRQDPRVRPADRHAPGRVGHQAGRAAARAA